MVLPTTLQHAALKALAEGRLEVDSVSADEFDKSERAIYESIKRLRTASSGPLSLRSIGIAATKLGGRDKDEVKSVLSAVRSTDVGSEVGLLINEVKGKRILADLVDCAGKQLAATGEYNPEELISLLREPMGVQRNLVPLADCYKEGVPDPPQGIIFPKLPTLQKATTGLHGIWAIGGEPGVGKSTLALQFAVIASQEVPTLYYDMELSDKIIANHLATGLGYGAKKMKQKTKQLYVRDSIKTFQADLQEIKPPALIVIDSFQALPTNIDKHRNSLNKWLLTFQQKVKEGYTFLIISEQNRADYGKASMKSFKETGDIEYKADLGAILVEDLDIEGRVHFDIVKNRHKPYKGKVLSLQRVNSWWYKEVRGRV